MFKSIRKHYENETCRALQNIAKEHADEIWRLKDVMIGMQTDIEYLKCKFENYDKSLCDVVSKTLDNTRHISDIMPVIKPLVKPAKKKKRK